MYCGEDLHRLLVGAYVGNLLIHIEQVAVASLDDLLTQTLDSGLEIEEYCQTGLVHAVASVATLLSSTRCNVTRYEVTECGVATLQVVVAILLSDIRRLDLACTQSLDVLHLLGNPDTTVVTQRLRHQRQLRLLGAVDRNTGGVNLSEAGVSKTCTLAIALECSRAVRCHSVGRQEEYVTVATTCDYNCVSTKALQLTGYQVTSDDTASLAILNNYVEHLVAGVALNRAVSDLLVQSCVSTEQQLLTGLTTSIERTRYLSTTERTVSQQTAVLTSERYALSYALVDNCVRHLSQTINVSLTCAVVATLDGVVEQTINRVVVVLVVLSGIDTTLSCDRVSAAGRVLNAEYLHVVTHLTERSSSRCATQTGTYNDDVELTLICGANHLDSSLMIAPLFGQSASGNLRI